MTQRKFSGFIVADIFANPLLLLVCRTGAMAETVAKFPADPTTAIHSCAIGWFPVTCAQSQINTPRGTAYRYDGAILAGPNKYPSVHPSSVVANLWTSADKYFSAGPPLQDAVVTIKRITAYYDKPNKLDNGACVKQVDCTPATACSVTL